MRVDGAGTFNGHAVTSLGIQKVASGYYEVQTNLLTSASDYHDLYAALQQACANLVGGASGISAENCQEVKDAVDATEMDQATPINWAPTSNDSYVADEDRNLTVNPPAS